MAKHNKVDYSQWGIDRVEFAAQEGVTPENISMRVKRFGTPFQRKAQPTMWERKYGKTMRELVELINIHPQSIYKRETNHGDVFREDGANRNNKGNFYFKDDHYKDVPWLCEQHPDYQRWRAGELFNEEYVCDSDQ